MTSRCVLILCLLPAGAHAGEAAFRFPAARTAGAELKYKDRLPVLVVEGTPAQMGAAVGKFALKPAKRILDYPRGLLDLHGIDSLWPAMLKAGKGMYRRFPDDYSRELEALA